MFIELQKFLLLYIETRNHTSSGLLEKIDEHVDTMMTTTLIEVANFNVCSHLFQLFVVGNSHTNLAIARVNFLSKAINLSDQFHEKGNKPSNKLDHQWHCRRVKQNSRYKTELHPPVVLSSSSLEPTQSMLYDSVFFFFPDKFCHFLQKNIANFVEKWVLLVKILLILLFGGKESPNFQYLKIEKEPLDHTQTSLAFTTVFFPINSAL